MHRDEVSLRGLRVHYAEAGSGPALLLVHGLLVSHKEWRLVLPRLQEHFRVLAPDLPGFGQSDKPSPDAYPYTREAYAETLSELLRALDVPQAHVCGHSMGGGVALTFAADHPERLERLSVLDSACYPFPLSAKGRLPLLPGIGPLIFKKAYRRPVFRDYFRNDVFSGDPGLDMTQVDEYYDDFDSPEGREAAYAALKRATVDIEGLAPKISRIEARSLVLWGDDDRIFPVSLAHRLVRELPRATLRVMPDCGHAPNEQLPAHTAEHLLAHHLGT
jgi:pimeloyl-ACP methyl ester carboxylesterase